MNSQSQFLGWYSALSAPERQQAYQHLQQLALAQSASAANSYINGSIDLQLPVEGMGEEVCTPAAPASLAMPPAVLQRPINGLLQMDQAASMQEGSSSIPTEAMEQLADQPAFTLSPSSAASIPAGSAVSRFAEVSASLLNNRLLPPQHRSLLVSLNDGIAAGSSGGRVEAFAEFLVQRLASMRPASFKSSHVWGPAVIAFQSFRRGRELTDQWQAALAACSMELPSQQVVRETLQYLVTGCNSSFSIEESKGAAQGTEGPPIDPLEEQKVFYISGYIVSQLVVTQFRKAKTDRHKAFRVDWPYIKVLEQLKVYRRLDGTIPDADIPGSSSAWQKAIDRGGLTYASIDFYELVLSLEQIFRKHVNLDSVGASSVSDATAAMMGSDSLRLELLNVVYQSRVSRHAAEGFDKEELGLQKANLLAPVKTAFVEIINLYTKVRAKAFGKAVQRLNQLQQGEMRNSDALRTELKNMSGAAPKRRKGNTRTGGLVEKLVLSKEFVQSLGSPADVHAFLQQEIQRYARLQPDEVSQGKGPFDHLHKNVLRGMLAMYDAEGVAPAGIADVAGRRGGSSGSKADILQRCYSTIGQGTQIVTVLPLLRTLK